MDTEIRSTGKSSHFSYRPDATRNDWVVQGLAALVERLRTSRYSGLCEAAQLPVSESVWH